MLLFILIVAVAAGAFGSMLGIGGGLVMVPALTLFAGVPVKNALGVSLLCVIATSSVGQTYFLRHHLPHIRLAMFLEIGLTLGAITGALTAMVASPTVLKVLFTAVLLWVAISMRGRTEHETVQDEARGLLSTAFVDPADGREIAYSPKRVPIGVAGSFVAGNVSGLLGVGGGIISVPLLNLVMKVPLKAAFATSNFSLGVTAAAGALIYYGNGLIKASIAVPAVLGVAAGAQMGPRLTAKLDVTTLRRIFRVVLILFALQMVVSVAGVKYFGR